MAGFREAMRVATEKYVRENTAYTRKEVEEED